MPTYHTRRTGEYPHRHQERAKRELAEQAAFLETKRPTSGQLGYFVNFSYGFIDDLQQKRVFVWAESRAAAKFKAGNFPEIVEFLAHGDSLGFELSAHVTRSGFMPLDTPEGLMTKQ